MSDSNLIRVKLEVTLDCPGKGVEPLEDIALTIALVNGLRAMGVDVRNAMHAKRRLSLVSVPRPAGECWCQSCVHARASAEADR